MDSLLFYSEHNGKGKIIFVLKQLSGCVCELRLKRQAEANIVVTVSWRIVVAISNTAVVSVVVPTAATIDAVRAFDYLPAYKNKHKI